MAKAYSAILATMVGAMTGCYIVQAAVGVIGAAGYVDRIGKEISHAIPGLTHKSR